MTTVIVPAHNEESTITRCLAALLSEAEPGEFEILVVCNGCTDGTVDVARTFHPRVQVLDTPIASKVVALNLGDAAATSFPRIYVDGDVELDTASLRRLVAVLSDGNPVAAASPTPQYDLTATPRRVAAYYRVWQRLPTVRDGLVGAGVYGLSTEGHRRIAPFPDVLGDDFYVDRHFDVLEGRRLADAHSRVLPVSTLGALVRRKMRVYAGNAERSDRRTENGSGGISSVLLHELRSRPGAWIDVPVFVGVSVLARLAHSIQRRLGREVRWRG